MQKFIAIPDNNYPKVPDYYQQKYKTKRNQHSLKQLSVKSAFRNITFEEIVLYLLSKLKNSMGLITFYTAIGIRRMDII